MRCLSAFVLLLLLLGSTAAQAACGVASSGQQAYDGAGQLCSVILPMPLRGQGNTIIPASTSTAINASLSLAANSAAFPTSALAGRMTIKNGSASANVAYICWQGGTCSATVGEPLAIGESVTESLPTQNMTTAPPTAFTVGATLTVKW